MYDLPTQWHFKTIDFLQPSDCIYGIAYDSNQLTCEFYLTNFEKAWTEELGRQSISKRASDLGIDELTEEKLVLLLETLVRNIPEKVQFQVGSDIIAQLDLDFSWRFELKDQPPEMTIQFLSKFNFQQFMNNSYLQYKIRQLKSILNAKESYAKFLELNFKQTHGEELIKQYKRNNKGVIHLITDFDSKKWEAEVKVEYMKQRKLNPEDLVKRDIENAVATTWISYCEDKPKPKTNKLRSSQSMDTTASNTNKRSPIGMLISPAKRSHSKSPSPKESPKRKKLG
ncbi:hypothetical protein CORT_0H01100 [Candida orthopsilosis Co 90-125]|uniref:XLF-like N-terminal domain-containing protein n=1 Tax=Candida orthopsilosis (strain 90-125) TaxID=1136231 RepID=H8XAX8_CANO9|nr:hypothetical protein CORT_0H01100 [Candida orthopsilosis Co 90-125]CCG25226.1 hypothetical protein CORT_0H01100 [Candida orthopsilosis Co 90-125]